MGQEAEERTVKTAEETKAQEAEQMAAQGSPEPGRPVVPPEGQPPVPPVPPVPPAPPEGQPPAPPEGQPPESDDKKPLRISSPEQVDDYIRVTTPGMWLLVAAILILLAAIIIWGFAGRVEIENVDKDGQATTEYVAPASFVTDGVTGN